MKICANENCSNTLPPRRSRFCSTECYKKYYSGGQNKEVIRPRLDVCKNDECNNPVPDNRWTFCCDKCATNHWNKYKNQNSPRDWSMDMEKHREVMLLLFRIGDLQKAGMLPYIKLGEGEHNQCQDEENAQNPSLLTTNPL